uniref:NELL2-interacting cell ontogeny regulator 1 n=1 Tax=Oryzias latipes TaxID=8090 RepID=A0A3P9KC41_ORYLA
MFLAYLELRDPTASSMASRGYAQAALVLLAVQLFCLGTADADQETGTVIPAESRPCVDCHAFEFMQRALQDLKKTAFNLDARTETLVLRAERLSRTPSEDASTKKKKIKPRSKLLLM